MLSMRRIQFRHYNIGLFLTFIMLTLVLLMDDKFAGLNCLQPHDCSDLYLGVANSNIKGSNLASSIIKEACPNDAVITFPKVGRLGNQISTYVNLLAIESQFGIAAYAPKKIISRVKSIFRNVTIPAVESIKHCNIVYRNIFDSFSVFMKKNADCVERTGKNRLCYPNILGRGEGIWIDKGHTGPRFEVIQPVEKSLLRHHLQLQPKLKASSISSIHSVRSSPDMVVVGVHVRRTDYYRLMDGRPFVGSDFIHAAGQVFVQKFGKVAFAVFSDDLDWCEANIKLPNTHFVGSKSARTRASIQDMSALASCDHAILTTSSTFGMWGAFLTRGQVIMPQTANFRYKYFKQFLNWTILTDY